MGRSALASVKARFVKAHVFGPIPRQTVAALSLLLAAIAVNPLLAAIPYGGPLAGPATPRAVLAPHVAVLGHPTTSEGLTGAQPPTALGSAPAAGPSPIGVWTRLQYSAIL